MAPGPTLEAGTDAQASAPLGRRGGSSARGWPGGTRRALRPRQPIPAALALLHLRSWHQLLSFAPAADDPHVRTKAVVPFKNPSLPYAVDALPHRWGWIVKLIALTASDPIGGHRHFALEGDVRVGDFLCAERRLQRSLRIGCRHLHGRGSLRQRGRVGHRLLGARVAEVRLARLRH